MTPVTEALPDDPERLVGPDAVRVQSVATAVPPAAAASTTLTSVSVGATAVLVMVQVAASPSASVTEVAVDTAAPVHTQADGV